MPDNVYTMAWANDIPWHKKGFQVDPDAPFSEWVKAGGLTYEVHKATVQYYDKLSGFNRDFIGKYVLYRSDNNQPLHVVSNSYNIVQPAEVIDFFHKVCHYNNFKMETIGTISGGKKIFGLAKAGSPKEIRYSSGDVVMPYVFLCTSYDGTYASTAKYTAVRVVCQNTMDIALSTNLSQPWVFSVNHTKKFKVDEALLKLDLKSKDESFERFMNKMNDLSYIKVDPYMMKSSLIGIGFKENSRGYNKILELFNKGTPGSEIPGVKGTAWDAVNALSFYTDHVRGREDSRFASSILGEGNSLKSKFVSLFV